MKWLKDTPLAHRGLHNEYTVPENSILAFKKAIENGYGIELDVRITKDNQVVVFHDKNLKRLFNSSKIIQDLNYDTLKEFKLYDTSEHIPLLKDVLELVDGKVPLLIEIKNYGISGNFEQLVYDVIKDYKGKLAICSFTPNVVSWFLKNHPRIKRGLIFGDLNSLEIQYHSCIFLYRYFKLKPHFVSLDSLLLDTFIINICRFFKIPSVSWIIKTDDKAKDALSKVDNIIFESIDPSKYS